MARTAQPAALKLVKGRGNGTDSGGRKVAIPPRFSRLAPKPPEWLSAEARAEWDRVVPGLTRLDLLKQEDRATLAAYCETWSTYVLAIKDVAERGLSIEKTFMSKDGNSYEQEIPNPSVAIARNEGKELRAWATHYGLTPSAESALAKGGDDGAEESNPFSG